MIVVVLGIAILAMVAIIVATIVKRMTSIGSEEAAAPAQVPIVAATPRPVVPAEPWTAAISLGDEERIVDLRLDQGRVLVTVADRQGRMRALLIDAASGARIGTIAAE